MGYSWDFSIIWQYRSLFVSGLWLTLLYTVTTVAAGLAIGLIAGCARSFAPKALAAPFRLYIEIFRCTPLLVQLIWMYYALPVLTGTTLSPQMASFLTLSLYTGAFYAEIFRGGIAAVDRGQWEAGKATGMLPTMVFRRIVLPQAVRLMIPSFINQTVMQLKNTSLVSTITVADLVYQGSVITAATYRPLEVYTAIAVLYLVVLFPITSFAEYVERRVGGAKA
ncbi:MULTISPECIES: amino acid ABC transporter permease [Pandoraea]|uniref:amino acid ABC transporter permease n=1 Tax=Pandoraea TaxID=93217 RepID=UPI0008464C41|nr:MULTISPECIES: amino acid ABC transporter permease [Pandoraea]MCI3203530.1 amino acid ABC transporter permease [Pandoraea sp. LA3]MDN4581556.1 amino acid ABC transporter permease [Pandoraea capi]ODP34473.1 ABC transporter permease [Pandoraea sp. ISTKB]